MTKNGKGAIVIGVIFLAVGAAAYLYTHNKRMYARTITKLGGHGSYTTLLTFQEGYLKQWAKALSKGKDEFTFEGKAYNTDGGMLAT